MPKVPPWQAHDGVARHRQRAVPGRDAVLADGRHRDDARSLSRRLARLHGPDTGSRGLFQQRHVAFLLTVRAGSRLGDHRTETNAAAPDVPTIAEAGVRGYDVTAWQALFVPAKTPPDIVRKISADTSTLSPTRRSRTSWPNPAMWPRALRPNG